eukprot:12581893-Alexandrium_andersonii.AAC.1
MSSQRQSSERASPFGEKVLFKIPHSATLEDEAMGWKECNAGIWVGYNDVDGSHMVLTHAG